MISVESRHAKIGVEMRSAGDLLISSIRGLPIRAVEADSSNSRDDDFVVGGWLPSGVCDGITASAATVERRLGAMETKTDDSSDPMGYRVVHVFDISQTEGKEFSPGQQERGRSSLF